MATGGAKQAAKTKKPAEAKGSRSVEGVVYKVNVLLNVCILDVL